MPILDKLQNVVVIIIFNTQYVSIPTILMTLTFDLALNCQGILTLSYDHLFKSFLHKSSNTVLSNTDGKNAFSNRKVG